jgi:PIN domain nuclease of toxin-antitoxin system
MKVLLDSHTLLWAGDNPAKVPVPAMNVMQNPANELLISAATLWEVAIKVALGKLPLSLPYRQWMDKAMKDQGLTVLAITLDHTERLSGCLSTTAIPSIASWSHKPWSKGFPW